jgi:hypothetical protein
MRDLDYYRSLKRPAADVSADDEVIVHLMYRAGSFSGRVTKTARVWINVRAPGYGEYRFRLDTQTDGLGQYRFATPEQYEFDERLKAAQRVLREHRVDVLSQAMVPDGHLIAMADLLAALDTPADTTEPEGP